jgi:hypothetical protein
MSREKSVFRYPTAAEECLSGLRPGFESGASFNELL